MLASDLSMYSGGMPNSARITFSAGMNLSGGIVFRFGLISVTSLLGIILLNLRVLEEFQKNQQIHANGNLDLLVY